MAEGRGQRAEGRGDEGMRVSVCSRVLFRAASDDCWHGGERWEGLRPALEQAGVIGGRRGSASGWQARNAMQVDWQHQRGRRRTTGGQARQAGPGAGQRAAATCETHEAGEVTSARVDKQGARSSSRYVLVQLDGDGVVLSAQADGRRWPASTVVWADGRR